MPAFDITTISTVSGAIADAYDAVIVALNTTAINAVATLTAPEKATAITSLIANSPKHNAQFTKMIELITSQILRTVKNEIFQKAYFIAPINPTGRITTSQITNTIENGAYYHTINANAASGFITGRIVFARDIILFPTGA